MKTVYLKQIAVSFIVGLIFAAGLAISGMTQPEKIIGFLNPWQWDASLLFVMVGAVGVHMISYPLVRKRKSPLLDQNWHVPTRKDLTARLIAGSALFGIGWGLGGFCPGPAITSLATGHIQAVLFVTAMIAGMLISRFSESYLASIIHSIPYLSRNIQK